MRKSPSDLEPQDVLERVETVQHADPMKGHIPALDGLRGLAILLVLMIHFCCLTGVVPRTTLDVLFLKFASIGWCGVNLFFLLSGFLITGILFDTKSSSNRMKNFYARRTLRIFPLYYGVLTLWFLVLPAFNLDGTVRSWPSQQKVWVWLYAVNWGLIWGGHQFGVMEHFWSLAVEEHFYLLWPLVIWFSSRSTAISNLRRLHLCLHPFTCSPGDVGVFRVKSLVARHKPSRFIVLGRLARTHRSRPLRFSTPRWTGEEARRAGLPRLGVRYPLAKGNEPYGFDVSDLWFPCLVLFFGAGLVLLVHARPSSLFGLIFNSRS